MIRASGRQNRLRHGSQASAAVTTMSAAASWPAAMVSVERHLSALTFKSEKLVEDT